MILFDLRCDSNHVFEAWFRDSETFDRQCMAGEIACPICGETRISKAPMAPSVVARGSLEGDSAKLLDSESALTKELFKELARLYEHIENSCEYVGDKFSEEARKIQSGDAERRDIYGEASEEETRALLEEGVEILRLPWVRRRHDS